VADLLAQELEESGVSHTGTLAPTVRCGT